MEKLLKLVERIEEIDREIKSNTNLLPHLKEDEQKLISAPVLDDNLVQTLGIIQAKINLLPKKLEHLQTLRTEAIQELEKALKPESRELLVAIRETLNQVSNSLFESLEPLCRGARKCRRREFTSQETSLQKLLDKTNFIIHHSNDPFSIAIHLIKTDGELREFKEEIRPFSCAKS